MKVNKLGFLSLLALLALLGLVTRNAGYYGFFGFLVYLRYFWVVPDELFQRNVDRAASIGFFTGLGATASAVVVCALGSDFFSPAVGFAIGFVLGVIAFTLALVVIEMKEQRG